jgi:hypothetical protein
MMRTKNPPGPIVHLPREKPQRGMISGQVDASELHDAVGDRAHRLTDGRVDVEPAV